MDALTLVEKERQEEIVLARKFHSGEHDTKLTARLKQFLGEDIETRLNVCRNVVSAVAERLIITGFDSESEALIQWAGDLWTATKMNAEQEDTHEWALRDGEAFVIVSWDVEEERPEFTPHYRYTDTSTGGDGFGCWMKYRQDDPNQKPEYGVKQWTEVANNETIQRRNLYYPDRIVKEVRRRGLQWESFAADELWVDNDGKPLGIAIVPFQNKGLMCEAWDAFPIQRAINKSLIDLLSSSDMTAFRIFFALGFIPTQDGKQLKEDGSNLLILEPGQVVGTTKSQKDAAFGAINPAELNPQMDLTHQLILWLATVTNTPVSRFVSTKLIASDETLKEQEGPLISRVTARQTRFGNSWVECLGLARRLTNTFGGEGVDEETPIKPIWTEPAARGEKEKLELLSLKSAIGVPWEQLWKEAGYDQATIKKMKGMNDERSRDLERGRTGRDVQSGNGRESRDSGGSSSGAQEDQTGSQEG
jgi:hypothetical protein